MKLLPLILLTSVILIVLLLAFSFRLFINKDAKLPGGTCSSADASLKDKGISCSCGGNGDKNCNNR